MSGFVGQEIGQYTIKERKGSSMNVFLGCDKMQKTVIIKVFAMTLSSSEQKAVNAEVKVGVQLSSTCIFLVRYEEVIMKKDQCFLIMEYCEMGDLGKIIANKIKSKEKLTDEEILRVIFHIGNAVLILHKENIVHRDLKPDNIFLAKNGIFKLGDFGISRSIDNNKTTVLMASIGYAPPEVLDGEEKLSKKMDVYSLGCIILEMIDMRHPFANEKNVVQQSRVFSGKANQPKATLSESMKSVWDFGLRMVKTNPTDRPSIEELLALPSVVAFCSSQYIAGLAAQAQAMTEDAFVKEKNAWLKEKDDLQLEIRNLKKELSQKNGGADSLSALARETNTQTPQQQPPQVLPSPPPQQPIWPTPLTLPVRFVVDRSNNAVCVTVAEKTVTWNREGQYWGILDREISSGKYCATIECSGTMNAVAFGVTSKLRINNHHDISMVDSSETCCVRSNDFRVGGRPYNYEKGEGFSSNGTHTLMVEIDADVHVVYFFADGKQISESVVNVPPGVHVAFCNKNPKVCVTVKSFLALPALTINKTLPAKTHFWK